MSAARRLRAVLKYKKDNIPRLIALALLIYAKMTESPSVYTSPPAALAGLPGLTKDLSDAQQGVKKRTVTASMRDTKRDALVTALETLRLYLQQLGDAAPEQAAALFEGAGLKVAAAPNRSKPILAAMLGAQAGSANLVANAKLLAKRGKNRCFLWQFTIDGKTFVNAQATPGPKTTITGLPSLTTCGFRVCVSTSAGTGDWTQVVSLLIH